jgi:signal recognition particle receptor subunit beta
MVLFNYSTKELTAKVVYYGPGLCGKTTNLQWIHEKLPIKNKGKMVSLATEADRTLFFDFLPIELGMIRGMKTRVQLYTVPGQVFYNATRRMVLKGADCVVFVVDSQEAMVEANQDAMANLRENLEANEIDPDEIPTVLQYNKRDLPNALPVAELNRALNPRGFPFYEACAKQGIGVEETLKGVTGLVFKSLAAKYGGGEGPPRPAPKPMAAPAPRPPAPPLPPPRPLVPSRPEPAPLAGQSAEDLLDSLDMPGSPPPVPAVPPPGPLDELDLGPAPSSPAMPPPSPLEELSLEPAPPPSPEFSMEELGAPAGAPAAVEPELSLEDLGAPAAMPAPAPPPMEPELSLEDLGAPGPAVEPELSLEDLGAPAAMPAPTPPEVEPELSLDDLGSPAAAPAVAPPPAAPVEVDVDATVVPGQREITVPIRLDVAAGARSVTLHLRIHLNLQPPR